MSLLTLKSINLSLLIVLFGWTANVYAQDTSGETDDAVKVANPVAVEDVVDDDAIKERLNRILVSRERYADVEVLVQNGVVTFDGTVDTKEDRQWVQELAERTEGVVVVDNQIYVEVAVNIDGSLKVIENSLTSLWRDFLARLPLMIAAAVVVLLTAIIARVVGALLRRLLSKRRIRSSLKDLLNQFATLGVWIAGLIIAAVVIFPGLTPAKALTVLGLGSVAVGFAFKDIFENFFAGVLILWRYPFDRGDFIKCDDIVGHVEEITVRNTMLRRLDGELSVIPNAHLFKSTVDVLTNRAARRVRITCGVAYDENVSQAREVIEEAVRKCSSVDKGHNVEIFAKEFADSSINFEVAWWTGAKPLDVRSSRGEVVEAIKSALDNASIEIPFPYRTLTFKEPLPISQRPGLDANVPETVNN